MPSVRLYANLRKLAGTKELFIPQAATLGDVLTALRKRLPSLADAVLEGDELRPHVVVTLNGRHAADWNAPVTDGDVIALFPPIAGGATLTPSPSPRWERGVQEK